ncbi:hypothetical protein F5141DRAFT_1067062 [Pisolithus sp. B1]|nr:hypothetical protein F5141DRAFT_1067062 [Pisolithus sp. B1]
MEAATNQPQAAMRMSVENPELANNTRNYMHHRAKRFRGGVAYRDRQGSLRKKYSRCWGTTEGRQLEQSWRCDKAKAQQKVNTEEFTRTVQESLINNNTRHHCELNGPIGGLHQTRLDSVFTVVSLGSHYCLGRSKAGTGSFVHARAVGVNQVTYVLWSGWLTGSAPHAIELSANLFSYYHCSAYDDYAYPDAECCERKLSKLAQMSQCR